MSNSFRIAALFGATGVALGAFGAHGLKAILAANESLEIWRTASNYHLLHAVALLCLAGKPSASGIAFKCFAAGLLLFSGSLYALAITNFKILGAVTPVGGLILIAGWLSLLFTGPQSEKSR